MNLKVVEGVRVSVVGSVQLIATGKLVEEGRWLFELSIVGPHVRVILLEIHECGWGSEIKRGTILGGKKSTARMVFKSLTVG